MKAALNDKVQMMNATWDALSIYVHMTGTPGRGADDFLGVRSVAEFKAFMLQVRSVCAKCDLPTPTPLCVPCILCEYSKIAQNMLRVSNLL